MTLKNLQFFTTTQNQSDTSISIDENVNAESKPDFLQKRFIVKFKGQSTSEIQTDIQRSSSNNSNTELLETEFMENSLSDKMSHQEKLMTIQSSASFSILQQRSKESLTQVIKMGAVNSTELQQTLDDLRNNPDVEYVEEDILMRPMFVPNDRHFKSSVVSV